MSFSQLPQILQTLECIWGLLIIVTQAALFVWDLQIDRGVLKKLIDLSVFFICFAVLQLLSADLAVRYRTLSSFNVMEAALVDKLPNFIIVSVFVVSTLIVVLGYIQHRSYDSSHVDLDSLRELCDDLPTALCYYYSSGKVLMVNRRMDEISESLFGSPVLNGAEFRDDLLGQVDVRS